MRPDRNDNLLAIAHVVSKRSTCSRLQVGAVFAREGRILVTGYNGAPTKQPHCNHECTCHSAGFEGYHLAGCNSLISCTQAEHAEKNAIAFAARYGVALDGSTLYLTDSPCLSCAYSIVNAGVTEVWYDREYRIMDGLYYLVSAGILIQRFESNE